MELLAQFLLRLAFGLAVGMAITSPQQVSSGFFRNHLYVTLGLATLAALALAQLSSTAAMWLADRGGRAQLYRRRVLGCTKRKRARTTDALACRRLSLVAALVASVDARRRDDAAPCSRFAVVDVRPGAWPRRSPRCCSATGISTRPAWSSRRCAGCSLVAAIAVVRCKCRVSGVGPGRRIVDAGVNIPLRRGCCSSRSAGRSDLFGVLALLWMAWQTLKIPNTQSATGILYVAVIGVFVGELTAAATVGRVARFPYN